MIIYNDEKGQKSLGESLCNHDQNDIPEDCSNATSLPSPEGQNDLLESRPQKGESVTRTTPWNSIKQFGSSVGRKVLRGAKAVGLFIVEHPEEIATVVEGVASLLIQIISKTSDYDSRHSDFSAEDTSWNMDYLNSNLEESPNRTIYTNKNEWKGYGKQNYYRYEYRLEDGIVKKYKCHRFKTFDGDESYWAKDEHVVDSWETDDPDMPQWLKKYL